MEATEITEDTPLIHICEVCGLTKTLTPAEAYQEGWDYPPGIGQFGIISPRTCGECGIDKTLYWRLITNKTGEPYQGNEAELELVARIQAEPGSILPKEE